jgi:hypothetical protein
MHDQGVGTNSSRRESLQTNSDSENNHCKLNKSTVLSYNDDLKDLMNTESLEDDQVEDREIKINFSVSKNIRRNANPLKLLNKIHLEDNQYPQQESSYASRNTIPYKHSFINNSSDIKKRERSNKHMFTGSLNKNVLSKLLNSRPNQRPFVPHTKPLSSNSSITRNAYASTLRSNEDYSSSS